MWAAMCDKRLSASERKGGQHGGESSEAVRWKDRSSEGKMRGSRDYNSELLFVWEETTMAKISNESIKGTNHVRYLAARIGKDRLSVSGCAGEWRINQWKDCEVGSSRRKVYSRFTNVGKKDMKSAVVINENKQVREKWRQLVCCRHRCNKESKGREVVEEHALFS